MCNKNIKKDYPVISDPVKQSNLDKTCKNHFRSRLLHSHYNSDHPILPQLYWMRRLVVLQFPGHIVQWVRQMINIALIMQRGFIRENTLNRSSQDNTPAPIKESLSFHIQHLVEVLIFFLHSIEQYQEYVSVSSFHGIKKERVEVHLWTKLGLQTLFSRLLLSTILSPG